jgi:hypothetical protein
VLGFVLVPVVLVPVCVGSRNLVLGFGLGPDDQKCFQRILLGFVVWGFEKSFLGVLTKNKIFYQFSFLEFYADYEF